MESPSGHIINLLCNNGDYIKIYWGGYRTVYAACKSDTTTRILTATSMSYEDFPWGYNYWIPVMFTWDFRSSPGTMTFRMFTDSLRTDTSVVAPRENASKIYIGRLTTDTAVKNGACFDNLAIYDGVMTSSEFDALTAGYSAAVSSNKYTNSYIATRDFLRRYIPRNKDVSDGNITFLATWDGEYDAIVGSDTTYHVTSTDAASYCLLPDGSNCRGQRFHINIGIPRHDLKWDDRKPIEAVLLQGLRDGAGGYRTLTNYSTHATIAVSQQSTSYPYSGQGVGWTCPWLDSFWGNDASRYPATFRFRVNLPYESNAENARISLGPAHVKYAAPQGGSGGWSGYWAGGTGGQVSSDAGNTETTFKTNITGYANNYWNGAEIFFVTGTNQHCRLPIISYNGTTGFVTVDGAFPNVPSSGDYIFIDKRVRILANPGTDVPTASTGLIEQETRTMEFFPWEYWNSERPWKEIEIVFGPDGASNSYLRVDGGRTVPFSFSKFVYDPSINRGICFGREKLTGDQSSYTTFSCLIMLESITVEGRPDYCSLNPNLLHGNSGYTEPLYLCDTFVATSAKHGHSSKVWRLSNLSLVFNSVTKKSYVDWENSLNASGTWRNTCILENVIQPYESSDYVICLARGTDSGGTTRLGYLKGTWDENNEIIVWEDETPPTGKANPFLNISELLPDIDSSTTWGTDRGSPEHFWPGRIFIAKTNDGRWVMTFGGNEKNPDHYITRILDGAVDRWTWDFEKHWRKDNPLPTGLGGHEILNSWGVIGLWGNRDTDWQFTYNPYTIEPAKRFAGICRLKTYSPKLYGATPTYPSQNVRPTSICTSGDMREFRLYPRGNAVQPVAAYDNTGASLFPVSGDTYISYFSIFTNAYRMMATNDLKHFYEAKYEFIQDASPLFVFRLQDKIIHVIYDILNSKWTYAWHYRDRESQYELSGTNTSGELETAVLEKPDNGWDKLYINCDKREGDIKAELVNPETGEPLTGYTFDDCDTIANGIQSLVSWGGVSLDECDSNEVQIRFMITRNSSADDSPQLFAWYADDRMFVLTPYCSTDFYVKSGTTYIEGAPVRIQKTGTDIIIWGTTDSNGLFSTILEPGDYTVRTAYTGFDFGNDSTVSIGIGDYSKTVTLEGTPIVDQTENEPNTCVVQGYAYDANGDPINDSYVIKFTPLFKELPEYPSSVISITPVVVGSDNTGLWTAELVRSTATTEVKYLAEFRHTGIKRIVSIPNQNTASWEDLND